MCMLSLLNKMAHKSILGPVSVCSYFGKLSNKMQDKLIYFNVFSEYLERENEIF